MKLRQANVETHPRRECSLLTTRNKKVGLLSAKSISRFKWVGEIRQAHTCMNGGHEVKRTPRQLSHGPRRKTSAKDVVGLRRSRHRTSQCPKSPGGASIGQSSREKANFFGVFALCPQTRLEHPGNGVNWRVAIHAPGVCGGHVSLMLQVRVECTCLTCNRFRLTARRRWSGRLNHVGTRSRIKDS